MELETPFTDVAREVGLLAETGTELIIVSSQIEAVSQTAALARQFPDTTFVYVDVAVPGVPSIEFAEHEGSFLVGAAAALTSRTGTIGFIGGFQYTQLERFRAGFEAGAKTVDPDIEILSTYVALNHPAGEPGPGVLDRHRHVPRTG